MNFNAGKFIPGPDHIPDATSSIQQVITPGKDERTYLEGQNFRLEIGAPVAVVRRNLPITPYKQLQQAPSEPSERSEDTSGGRKRGMNCDDTIKLAFLSNWIEYSEEPFGHNISKFKSTKVKLSINNIMK